MVGKGLLANTSRHITSHSTMMNAHHQRVLWDRSTHTTCVYTPSSFLQLGHAARENPSKLWCRLRRDSDGIPGSSHLVAVTPGSVSRDRRGETGRRRGFGQAWDRGCSSHGWAASPSPRCCPYYGRGSIVRNGLFESSSFCDIAKERALKR